MNFADHFCITFDVDWAHPEVLADTVRLVESRGLACTFFCTHAGIELPGHERALHPNYRLGGDTMRAYDGPPDDERIFRHVVARTKSFCPEAVGARSHCLFYDSSLMAVYAEQGVEYDSTYALPLSAGLAPVWKERGVLEMPIYYMDHIDLMGAQTGFELAGLQLDRPGLKVFDFHPIHVFLNTHTEAHYAESRAVQRDPDALLKKRHPGPGVRTLFEQLLDYVATASVTHSTLADVNRAARAAHGAP
ncbi:MAG: hypothetical protein KC593_16430 [Myxococcales bacterium]|nr:hypothetical protein [Myxococcales bacterium]MCB9627132.1 hypothetical protein [Sandaracinaceae bacterium]